MPQILLHQYDSSPFSEKVRVCLGIKGVAWGAVDQPVIMPKPALLPLTGGYRRIPVMQIGADIYCDSQLIVRELERRFPEPTLFPGGGAGLAQASAQWTDRGFFQAAVAVIFGGLGDKVPDAFIRDREALSGRPFDPSAMKAVVPQMTQQLRAHVGLISQQLQDGRAFLSGDQPGLVDANAYYCRPAESIRVDVESATDRPWPPFGCYRGGGAANGARGTTRAARTRPS
jgi:glutathione S-transferase